MHNIDGGGASVALWLFNTRKASLFWQSLELGVPTLDNKGPVHQRRVRPKERKKKKTSKDSKEHKKKNVHKVKSTCH